MESQKMKSHLLKENRKVYNCLTFTGEQWRLKVENINSKIQSYKVQDVSKIKFV